MVAPKKPQDHKPKVEKPSVDRVAGGKSITHQGVTVTVADEALDDFELLDDLRALDVDSNASRLPGVLRRLVGDDYPKVLDALRNDKGRVTIEAGTAYIKDVFEAIAPNS